MSERLPAVEMSAALSAIVTWVALVYVVVRAEPFTLMTVAGTNPVPVTVTTGDVAPVTSIVGDTDAIAGAGLSTSRFSGVPDPLLTDPFDTTTANSVPLAI
jgi:hypothetical protein